MNKKELLVSVVMPAYNADKYIGEAIESILNQTFKDFEFIILDDCSTDKTWEIIQEYAKKDERIIPVKNEKNLKIAATLNKGINMARGKYIARMDADDWSFPYRFEKQVDYMECSPEVVMCGGNIEITDTHMRLLNYRGYPLTDDSIRGRMFRYSPFAHPAVFYLRDKIIECGLYNEYFSVAQDYDLYFRIGKLGKLGNVSDVILKLRLHSKSSSQKYLKRQELTTLIIRAKAWVVYEYPIRFFDVFFSLMQFIGVFIIPRFIKLRIFNFWRSSKRLSKMYK